MAMSLLSRIGVAAGLCVRVRTQVGMLVRGRPVSVKVSRQGFVDQTRSRQLELRLLAPQRVQILREGRVRRAPRPGRFWDLNEVESDHSS